MSFEEQLEQAMKFPPSQKLKLSVSPNLQRVAPSASESALAGRIFSDHATFDSPAVGNDGRACFVKHELGQGIYWLDEIHPLNKEVIDTQKGS